MENLVSEGRSAAKAQVFTRYARGEIKLKDVPAEIARVAPPVETWWDRLGERIASWLILR
jgi:hypothetical protein